MTPPAGPLVLVVDDTEDNREMYAMYLAHVGFRVATAADGATALTMAQQLRPAVIVLDLSMPGVDGWEVCRRLKSDARTKHIPVIAVTGHALEGAEAHARAAGCDGYQPKPCLPEDLAAEIGRQIARAPERG